MQTTWCVDISDILDCCPSNVVRGYRHFRWRSVTRPRPCLFMVISILYSYPRPDESRSVLKLHRCFAERNHRSSALLGHGRRLYFSSCIKGDSALTGATASESQSRVYGRKSDSRGEMIRAQSARRRSATASPIWGEMSRKSPPNDEMG
jgi:hypothetical protein